MSYHVSVHRAVIVYDSGVGFFSPEDYAATVRHLIRRGAVIEGDGELSGFYVALFDVYACLSSGL